MSLLHELSIADHPPRPAEELYPILVVNKSLCTDMSFFRQFGDTIVSVHRSDGGVGLEGWQDSLLLFTPEAIRELIEV